jgi:hypothetical protein
MRSKTPGPLRHARRTGRRVFTARHPRTVVSRSPSPVFLPPPHTTGPGSRCWL